MIKDLFRILVTVSVNVMNHVIEECTENIEEVKLAKITSTKDKNKHKYSFCTLYIVLISAIFFIFIGT